MEAAMKEADHLKTIYRQASGRFDKAYSMTNKLWSDLNTQHKAEYDGVGTPLPEDVYTYAAHTWENLQGARKEWVFAYYYTTAFDWLFGLCLLYSSL